MQDESINLEDYSKSDWSIMLADLVISRFATDEGSRLIIGRSPDADVVIDHPAISGHHSSLELRGGRHYLADLKSGNGTRVNGKMITSKVVVTEKDVIFLDKFRLIQAATEEEPAPASSANATNLEEQAPAAVFAGSPRPQAAARTTPPSAPAGYQLTVIEGDASPGVLPLEGKSRTRIGKDPSCDMIIPGWLVSGTQCQVVSREGKYYLVPQSSWTSTRLNEVIIKEERLLRRGDTIQIKNVKIRFD